MINENTYDFLGLRRHYYIQMVFSDGSMTKPIAICEQIILSECDVVLNMAAQKLGGNSRGILVLFGLGAIKAFNYENKKLKEMK